MPKILQMFKGHKRRKGRLRRVLGLPNKAAANIIQYPQVMPEVQEEYPDYEIISRWLRLADEMLGGGHYKEMDDDNDSHGRKKA